MHVLGECRSHVPRGRACLDGFLVPTGAFTNPVRTITHLHNHKLQGSYQSSAVQISRKLHTGAPAIHTG
jgi:hypothetical protein